MTPYYGFVELIESPLVELRHYTPTPSQEEPKILPPKVIITTAQCQQNDIDFGLEKLEKTKGKMLQDKVGMFHFHWYLCQLLRSEVCQRSRRRQWNS